MNAPTATRIQTPVLAEGKRFHDAHEAVAYLQELYQGASQFLCEAFQKTLSEGAEPGTRYRAFYPEIRMTTATYAVVDSRLSFGHVSEPGTYAATITRPDLFENYLRQQIGLLLKNHGGPVSVGPSMPPASERAVASSASLAS